MKRSILAATTAAILGTALAACSDAVTSPSANRGYTAFALSKMSRLQGASGIHVGTMGYGKMESDPEDRNIAYMIERDECQGPVEERQRFIGRQCIGTLRQRNEAVPVRDHSG